ncbi:Na+/H+ antiporter NhaC family protein [Flavobacterium agricola]|uniref:Na+/H+ antiporter NhaC family protein n=1 Tax=Flavobacterium agricola TaxID=2870839 RepID=A0ABY6M0H1_9FLAO|nr:Na+/H+ antiporter NhaC family protein [Flavobacterium agricola]UYW02021.1 Na+/H+ antiporter NhaC family protein [Flavobacterium agricola]
MNSELQNNKKASFISLIPFAFFIFSFLAFGIITESFYTIPSPIAVIIGIASAVLLYKGAINDKMETFIKGCGDSKIITMCIIYLLAGAFAVVTKYIGGVDAIVNLGLNYFDLRFLPLGVFLVASFLSTASGTSVGSIVALGPIVMGFHEVTPELLPLLAGALLGGSMLGDNLSMISDTTIAATQSLDCDLKDKFKVNLYIALPAAVVTVIILLFIGFTAPNITAELPVVAVNYWTIIPYLLVIVLAILGLNVFVTLFIGILFSGLIGFSFGSLNWITYCTEIYNGFLSMIDIFLLSLLTGGLAAMVEKQGGIAFLVSKIKKLIKTPKSAQVGIGVITSCINSAIANNTVSIVVAGPIVKDISDEYQIDNRKSATIMDIFSCIIQGLLPYGAQVLLLLSYEGTQLSYGQLFISSFYLYILLIFTLIAIYFKPVDRYLSKMR